MDRFPHFTNCRTLTAPKTRLASSVIGCWPPNQFPQLVMLIENIIIIIIVMIIIIIIIMVMMIMIMIMIIMII